MNKSRNNNRGVVERLSARSLVLSVLLGGHPPRLPMPAVLALGDLFGVPRGTMRTALSRMVATGEVATDDGRVELTGRLLDRQRRQDAGRRAPPAAWNGHWWTVLAEADARSMAERRSFRSDMTARRFGELRPDTWLRPANGPAPTWPAGVVVTTGPLHVDDLDQLVRRLWPLDDLAAEAERLLTELDELRPALADGPTSIIPEAFAASAAVVRFLTNEPRLPTELVAQPWPTDELRPRYDRFELLFQSKLRSYLATAADHG